MMLTFLRMLGGELKCEERRNQYISNLTVRYRSKSVIASKLYDIPLFALFNSSQ
jgi:hypothetical protein